VRDFRETQALLVNLDRDVHELEGLLRGIALDGRVVPAEIESLREWCNRRRDVRDVGPFAEVIPLIEKAIAGGGLEEEARSDILWYCEQLRTPSVYYSVATSDLQRLHGMLAGIAADGIVDEKELRGLSDWMFATQSLRGTWPYDEVEKIVKDVLADGRIDDAEQKFLIAFTTDFLRSTTNLVIEKKFDDQLVRYGVCAAKPEIVFDSKRFCFTGTSRLASRDEMESIVRRLGGSNLEHVTRELDFLVVAAERGRSWAFSCYGRKVEIAVELRKRGSPLAIVNEDDFWAAAKERGVEPPRGSRGS
jgi:hypothetical protein